MTCIFMEFGQIHVLLRIVVTIQGHHQVGILIRAKLINMLCTVGL